MHVGEAHVACSRVMLAHLGGAMLWTWSVLSITCQKEATLQRSF